MNTADEIFSKQTENFDYYYAKESDQFSFFRIPKLLFTDEKFVSLSCEAKLLYGMFLDRMSLSSKNGWKDQYDRVFIIYTHDEIMADIHCAKAKASNIVKELAAIGLIQKKKRGLGMPDLIFVKNFVGKKTNNIASEQDENFKKFEKQNSTRLKNKLDGVLKSNTNYTDYSKTDMSNTNSFLFTSFQEKNYPEPKRSEPMQREDCEELIKENISYDALITESSYSEQEQIEELKEIIVDTVCSAKKTIRISGEEKNTELVKARFLKLNKEHIEFTLYCLKKNTTRVRNIKQYLIVSLYNAPVTISNYYDALFQHNTARELLQEK